MSAKKLEFFTFNQGFTLPLEQFNIQDFIHAKTINAKPCQIHKIESTMFCFDCRISICVYCKAEHMNHCMGTKNKLKLSEHFESNLFEKIDSELSHTYELSKPKRLYDFFMDKLNLHFKYMQDNLEKYRIRRIRELNEIFEKLETYAKAFDEKYKRVRSNVSRLKDMRTFFPSNYFSDVIFLQIFQLYNSGLQNEKRVLQNIREVKQCTVRYEEELSKSLSDLESTFSDSFKQINLPGSMYDFPEETPFNKFDAVLDFHIDFIEKFRAVNCKRKRNLTNKSHGLNNSIDGMNTIDEISRLKDNKAVTIDSGERHEEVLKANNREKTRNLEARKTFASRTNAGGMNMQDNAFYKSMENIDKEEHFLDKITNTKSYEVSLMNYILKGELRINKITSESEISKLDDKRIKSNKSLGKFSRSPTVDNFNSGNSGVNITSGVSNYNNFNTMLNPQSKVNNNIYSVSNYFLNLLLVYHQTNGKTRSKLVRDSPIPKNSYLFSSPMTIIEEEGNDLIKAIEGTKQLQLYDFNTKRPYKISISQLNKKDHGYDFFPYGVRCFHKQDVLYITGGRDIHTEFNVILCYYINHNELKVMDSMKFPRSYHSLAYHESGNCLYIIGGENNDTCEKFDLNTERVLPMPCMTSPRANASVYIYKKNFLYVFCGFESSINYNKVNATIESIDLDYGFTLFRNSVEFDRKWQKVDVSNHADVLMQFQYVGIMPITDSHIFLYGGIASRTNNRTLIVFDFIRNTLYKFTDRDFKEVKLNMLLDEKFNDLFDKLY